MPPPQSSMPRRWRSRLWDVVKRQLGAAGSTATVQEALGDAESWVYTGAQLLALVDSLAALLQPHLKDSAAANTATPPIVGLYLSNSACYIAAALATLKLGAAFLPLDSRWPPAQLQQVLQEAQPAAILWAPVWLPGGQGPPVVAQVEAAATGSVAAAAAAAAAGREAGGVVVVEVPAQLLSLRQAAAGTAAGTAGAAAPTAVPEAPGAGAAAPATALPNSSGAAAPAQADSERADGEVLAQPLPFCYVLYTSGSTGSPLGVCGTEQGILNRCSWMRQAHPFAPGDAVAFKTSACFVDSIWEVFGPLLAGVLVVVISPAALVKPQQLLETCARLRVTHLAAVPTLWRALLECLEASPGLAARLALRVAVSSGEPLPQPLLARMQALLPRPRCVILNLYGSTEVAADCTAFDCTSWSPGAIGGSAAEPPRPQGGSLLPGKQQAAGGVERLQAGANAVPVGSPIADMWVGIVRSVASSTGTSSSAGRRDSHSASMIISGRDSDSGSGGGGGGGGASGSEAGLPQPRLEFLPAGQPGEVVVGGEGLAAGYLNQPGATARRFVEVPWAELPASFRVTVGPSRAGKAAAVVPASKLANGPAGVAAGEAEATAEGPPKAAAEEALGQAEAGAKAAAEVAMSQAEAGAKAAVEVVRDQAEAGAEAAGSTARLFLTGDLGWVDAEGRLWLHGRKDLQVKISGVRFGLAEVESALCQHPAVHAAAARLWELHAGPALAAYVELKPSVSPQAAEEQQQPQPSSTQLRAWCQQRLPPAAVPAAVVLLPRLPRSAAGKVQRSELALPAGWQQRGQQARHAQQEQQQEQLQRRRQQQQVKEEEEPRASPHAAVPAFESVAAAEGAESRPAKRARQEALGGSQGSPFPNGSGQGVVQTQPPPSEAQVAAAFAGALRHALVAAGSGSAAVTPLEPTSSIFSLGADSLAVAGIAQALGISPELVYEHPTVRSLAARLRSGDGEAAARRQQRHGQQRHGQQGQQQGQQQEAAGQGAGFPSPPAASSPQKPGWSLEQLARPLLPSSPAPPPTTGAGLGEASGEASEEQQRARHPALQLAWRARMLQCVDAPALAAAALCRSSTAPAAAAQQDAAPSQHASEGQPGAAAAGEPGGAVPARVFACSHGGDVCCFDVGTGEQLWRVELPDMADVGLALCHADVTVLNPSGQPVGGGAEAAAAGVGGCNEAAAAGASSGQEPPAAAGGGGRPCVAVGTNGGQLHFLDAASGCELGSVDTGGALRAPPVVDPWFGLVWVASHGRQLLVLQAPGMVVARQPCSAAVSAQITFHEQQYLAYLASLDGYLTAYRVSHTRSSSSSGGGSGSGNTGLQLQLQMQWQHCCGAPLFAPPLLVREAAGTAGTAAAAAAAVAIPESAEGVLLAAAVVGSITALAATSGRLMWRRQLGSALFTPLVLLGGEPSLTEGQQQQRGASSPGRGGNPLVLAATQAGDLCVVDAGSGSLVGRVPLGLKVTGLCTLPQATSSAQAECLGIPEGLIEPGGSSCPAIASGGNICGHASRSYAQDELLVVCTQPGIACLVDAQDLLGFCTAAGQGSELVGGSEHAAKQLIEAAVAVAGGGSRAVAAAAAAPRWLLDAVQLPGEVFSTPAAVRGDAFVGSAFAVGCRDDHVYCLHVVP